jgi:ABC-type bacteriocin/lantibiotic exporter with double-glycine peptidase domain
MAEEQKQSTEIPHSGWDWLFIFILLVWWISGLVLAKGFWATLFAMITPFGLYLVIEQILVRTGFIG